MTVMENNQRTRTNPFSEACLEILFQHPEAIGVAYKVLDCGCTLLCGVSASGDPAGHLLHISSQPKIGRKPAPICLKCRKESGLDRVVWEGVYWPGTQEEWPEKDLRVAIGQKVFGPGYAESE
jgi:hypothetical protein